MTCSNKEWPRRLGDYIRELSRVARVALVAPLCWHSAHANILGLFPAGPGCKSAAIESSGDCFESQTLLYNPAVMAEIKPGFAGEIGFARLQYSYEHPQYDPVRVSLWTPVFSEGWKGSALDDRLAWGFAVAPTSSAELNIKGLPRRIGTNVESLRANAERRIFHLPVGVSYRLADNKLSLGAAVIYTYDRRSLKAATVEEPDSQLISQKASGHFFKPILGARYLNGATRMGLSYIFPLSKKYAGTTRLVTADAPFATELREYDPAGILTNIQTDLGQFTLSANLNHYYAAAGRNVQRDGVERKTTQADLKDANQMGARILYHISESEDVSFGYAHLYSIWGDGEYSENTDGFIHHKFGHAFGQFNAIPVRNQSLTWRRSFDNWLTHAAIFRSAGTMTVGPGGDNPGFYQLEFVSLSVSLSRQI